MIANDEEKKKKEEENANLSKSARLDYFLNATERSLSGTVYIRDRPIPRERSSPTRIRRARDKQESFDACLPACLLARRKETRLRNFGVAGTSRASVCSR